MDQKDEKAAKEGESCCKESECSGGGSSCCKGGCCPGKAALGLVLLLIGGLIGFAIGHGCGHRGMCGSMMPPCPMSSPMAPSGK